jgi:hypothetical protein
MERKIRRRITMGLTLPQLPLLFKPFDEEVNLQRNRISLSSLAFPHFILPSP